MELIAFKTPLVTTKLNLSVNAWLESLNINPVEGSILVISGKVISILTKQISYEKLETLLKKECEAIYGKGDFVLTRKNGRLIPNAGIDNSNVNEGLVCLPAYPQETACELWKFIRKKWKIKKVGVIITDSNVTPLRRGTTGIGIGWCGFKSLRDYRGKKDLFRKVFRVSIANLLDGLASAAVLMMGEGKERTPIVLIKDPPVVFQNRIPTLAEVKATEIPKEEDLFSFL